MENELISVNHDMFKEETIKRFDYGWDGELMDYISIVGDYLPQYKNSEYTFETSFHKYCCMNKYDAHFNVLSKSNASGDSIFLELTYSLNSSRCPERKKIENDKLILRIDNTNITPNRFSIDQNEGEDGRGWNVTLLYDISKELLKQIADAKQLYVHVPLMKELQDIKKEIFTNIAGDKTEEDKQRDEREWQELQETYEYECKSFQLMSRLFYAAAIDETAYPGLVEKEINILQETKRKKEQESAEFRLSWEQKQQQKEKEATKSQGGCLSTIILLLTPAILGVGYAIYNFFA